METAFKVVLDIYEVQNQATISIKQGDTSGKLYITLCAYREKYIIPEGATAVLRMLKNNSPVFKACDIQENVITCDIGFVTEFVGAHDLELAIYKDGKVLLTQTLIVKVYSNVYGNTGEGEIVNSDPFSALTELVSEATDLIHEVETKLENGDFVGEKGDQGEKGEDGTIITVNGEEQSTWNADTKADVYEVENVREETNMLWDEVFIIYDDLNHASTRISKVEQDTKLVKEALFNKGIIAVAEVEQAYTSRVTANGENIVDGQKTPVTMIKGSTVRCENLLGTPYSNPSGTTQKGITWTYDEYGVITVNGTATAISNRYLMNNSTTNVVKKAGTYTISMVNGSSSYYLEVEARDITSNTWLWGKPVSSSYTFTLNDGEYLAIQARVANGVTANNQKIYVMLNEGSTALPWQPYFPDLKHAKIDSIVSTGKNLLDISKFVGNALVDNGDGTYTISKNGNVRFSLSWYLDTPMFLEGIYAHADFIENTTSETKFALRAFNKFGQNKTAGVESGWGQYSFAGFGEIVRMDFYLNSTIADGKHIKFKNLSLTRQSLGKDVPFTPFIQETYQLPETLELGEWDSFNPQTGEITRATSKQLVLTGDENWIARGTNGDSYRNYIYVDNPNSVATASEICAVSNLYNGVTEVDTYNRIKGVSLTSNILDIYDPDFATNDVSLWEQHLKDLYTAGTPLIVEYKLATPTVEKLENVPKPYTAYNQGNETAVLENEEFGAIPTITNEYIVVL